MVTIKSKSEIEKMREACRVAALAQQAVEKAIRPGISTWELFLKVLNMPQKIIDWEIFHMLLDSMFKIMDLM